jgi:outer membrane lipopolysaccharide assembly protein LptE/RlpB
MKLQGFSRLYFRSVCIALMMLCVACGWQLQGVHHLSTDLQPLYVQYADAHSTFSRALQQRLRTSGVQMAQNESEARMVLQITKEDAGHRVISVSARNTPEEYEVYYNVEFTLRPHAGDSILQQPLHAAQTMTYDETHALAKQREENMLSESMAGELADQLLRQIRRL